MASYLPASGVLGSMNFNNINLSAAVWNWHEEVNVIDAPSFTGAPYMEYAIGMARGVFEFSGTWNLNFNPHANGMKIGNRGTAIFRINGAIVARAADVIVQSWDVVDDSDGAATYVCRMVGDWQFYDFAGGPARA